MRIPRPSRLQRRNEELTPPAPALPRSPIRCGDGHWDAAPRPPTRPAALPAENFWAPGVTTVASQHAPRTLDVTDGELVTPIFPRLPQVKGPPEDSVGGLSTRTTRRQLEGFVPKFSLLAPSTGTASRPQTQALQRARGGQPKPPNPTAVEAAQGS